MEPCAHGRSMRFKQRAAIEFLTAEGVTPKEIHLRMQAVYGDCVDVSTVRRWASKFKDGEAGTSDLHDNERVGRSVTATTELNMQKVDRLIQDDRRITQRDIASIIGISQECVGHIIALLGYQKICARWVPRMLTSEMKAHRLEIVTGDETWVHHYGLENFIWGDTFCCQEFNDSLLLKLR